jgi:hypothetical protein
MPASYPANAVFAWIFDAIRPAVSTFDPSVANKARTGPEASSKSERTLIFCTMSDIDLTIGHRSMRQPGARLACPGP